MVASGGLGEAIQSDMQVRNVLASHAITHRIPDEQMGTQADIESSTGDEQEWGNGVMAEYGKLYGRIWSDPSFMALDARAQQVYCMMVSFSTRNHAGVLPITLKRWTRATMDATPENVQGALNVLAVTRFIVIDWDTDEVLVRTFIKNDEVYKQPNLLKAALRQAVEVESASLKWELHEQLLKLPAHKDDFYTKDVANALVRGLPPRKSEPFHEPHQYPIAEDSGVGAGGYVGTVVAPAPTTSPETTPSSTPTKAVALRAPKSKALEHKMPEDWRPEAETVEWINSRYPGVDVEYEANDCRGHFLDKPTIRRAGWERTFKKWVERGAERGTVRMLPGRRRPSPGAAPADVKSSGWSAMGER